jgi:hypothetical protein
MITNPVKRYMALYVLYALISGGVFAAEPEPIILYDLQYANAIDAKDPRQLEMAWDHCHLVSALQGIVNRDAPRLYILSVESNHRKINIDQYWLDYLRKPGNWLAERPIRKVEGLVNLVRQFASEINGAVVYDPKVGASSNVASTVAGVENLLPIRFDTRPDSLYSQLVTGGPKLAVKVWLVNADGSSRFTGQGMIPNSDRASTGSAKCDAYLWMKQRYLDTGLCDGGYGAYYIDQYWLKNPRATVLNHHCLTNHDYFISQKAFFFDLHVWADEVPIDDPQQKPGTDLETLKELLLSAYNHGGNERMIHIGGFVPWANKYTSHVGGKHEPVATEWEYGKVISAYNGYMDADAVDDGAMANASFFRHFPLKAEYPQRWTSRQELIDRKLLTADGQVNVEGRQFVIFYVGDYDCAAWLYQWVPLIWDDPNRGKVPMMWAIGPHLARRAPMAMDYQRRTATAGDFFVASDNGAGYCEPGMLQEPRGISGLPSGLDAWQKHCEVFYRQWGLTVTGFIIYAHGPVLNDKGYACYAAFSPNGIVPQFGPATLLAGNMPVLRHDHDVQEDDPAVAAEHVLRRIEERTTAGLPPFHWFRNILKTPTWYLRTNEEIVKRNPKVELLDAPAFFELYRIYLQTHPELAAGKP